MRRGSYYMSCSIYARARERLMTLGRPRWWIDYWIGKRVIHARQTGVRLDLLIARDLRVEEKKR